MAYEHIPLTLEQHQQILYEILYMVDDYCKAHDIPYFLVGGSLLGAVRHQGIIPWDDDVDIAMTRENYNRFIDLFHAEGVTGYELFDFEHTDGYLYPFARMAKMDVWTEGKVKHNIIIDIFVYDGCGDNMDQAQLYFATFRKKIHKFFVLFLQKIPFSCLYDCWKAKVVYFMREFPSDVFVFYPMYLIPYLKKRYLSRINSHCSCLSVYKSKYSACIVWGVYGKGEVQPSDSFINLDKMHFGTRELPVPSGWHDYLTGIYGDYMTPLPESERHQHLKHGSYLIIPKQNEKT